jgi:hypothetical protein
MSDTTSGPGGGPPLPPRSTGTDPWPHEHGEHPSGVSVPDGAPVHHDHLAHLIGEPVVIHRGARHRLRTITWVVAATIAAGAVVALALLL